MESFVEKRESERLPKEIALSANLVYAKNKEEHSYDIPVTTENISRGGMMILWPKGWECQECKNCLFWIFNTSCKLKNNSNNGDFNKPLTNGCLLRFKLAQPHLSEIEAEVVWVKWSQEARGYNVGLRFLEEFKAFPF